MNKDNLILLFLLPVLLLTMMLHNMEIVMRRKEDEKEGDGRDQAPTKFLGRFSDYDQIIPNLPEHEMKMGSGMAVLLWGFSMMTLNWGAIVLWCAGAALLHCMIPDDDEPRGGRGHFYK